LVALALVPWGPVLTCDEFALWWLAIHSLLS